MAEVYDHRATQDAVRFDLRIQRELLALTHQICGEERWRLEAAAFDPSHIHAVVSWVHFCSWEEVDRRLKNLLAYKMNRRHGTPGKLWFVRRHGAPRRVTNLKHLRYLLSTYLPDHPGLFWRRGMKVPKLD